MTGWWNVADCRGQERVRTVWWGQEDDLREVVDGHLAVVRSGVRM